MERKKRGEASTTRRKERPERGEEIRGPFFFTREGKEAWKNNKGEGEEGSKSSL